MKKEDIEVKEYRSCTSHYCRKCRKKLRTNMSFGNKVFIIVLYTIMVGMMGLMFWWENTISSQFNCYTRTYLSGRGTDIETLQTRDIKCPF